MRILLMLFLTLIALAALLVAVFYGIGRMDGTKQPAQLPIDKTQATELISDTRTLDTHIIRLRIDGPINVNLKQAATPSLNITGNQYELAHVLITQDSDTLHIAFDTPSIDIALQPPRKIPIQVDISLPELTELHSDGVGRYNIDGFHGDTMQLYQSGVTAIRYSGEYKHLIVKQSGTGNLAIDAHHGDTLEISQSGAGRMQIQGTGHLLKAKLSGIGNLDTRLWQADRAELKISGVGNASVYVRQAVKINLSGVRSLHVYGNPSQRDIEQSGIGKIYWE
jgi:hypothetical protein